MPFNPALRNRLLVLKEEKDSGLLPQVVYEELCRSAIHEFGTNAYEAESIPSTEQIFVSEVNADFTMTNQSSDQSPNSSDPPTKHAQSPNSSDPPTKHASSSNLQIVPTAITRTSPIDLTLSADSNNADKRKFNKGLSQRRSYSKEEKLLAVALRDSGISSDDVSTLTGVSRSNVEKWNAEKAKSKIVDKARAMMNTGIFTRENVAFFGEHNAEQRDALINRVTTVALIDTVPSCALLAQLFDQALSSQDMKTMRPNVQKMHVAAYEQFEKVATPAAITDHPGVYSSSAVQAASSSSRKRKLALPYSAEEEEVGDEHDEDDLAFKSSALLYGLANEASNIVLMGADSSDCSLADVPVPVSAPKRAKKTSAVTKKPATSKQMGNKQQKQSGDGGLAKKSKLMEELTAAAELYYDEANGTSSMDIAGLPPVLSRASSAEPTSLQDLRRMSEMDDEDYLDNLAVRVMYRREKDVPVSQATVSDITMSFDSSMLDNAFSVDTVSMGISSQALRPVLKNTAFLTSFHGKDAALNSAAEELGEEGAQYAEDKRILSLLGERQYVRGRLAK